MIRWGGQVTGFLGGQLSQCRPHRHSGQGCCIGHDQVFLSHDKLPARRGAFAELVP